MFEEFDHFMKTWNSPEIWDSLDDRSLCELTFRAVHAYGYSSNPELQPILQKLYVYFRQRIEIGERKKVYENITQYLDDKTISFNALLPFLIEDDNKGIVSTATIDYCAYRPLDNDDPLTAVKEIIAMIVQQKPMCICGLFGGLLYLGDKRVNSMLWKIREGLSCEEVHELATIHTGILYTSTFEFYLDWLEELQDPEDDYNFGSVASALILALRQAKNLQGTDNPKVFDQERIFPVSENGDIRNLVKEYDFSEYRDLMAPRLLSISDKEVREKVMHTVLGEWGICST